MQKENASAPLWQFPITAMPDAPAESVDPMEMIARWQEEIEANATVDADSTSPRTSSRRRR